MNAVEGLTFQLFKILQVLFRNMRCCVEGWKVAPFRFAKIDFFLELKPLHMPKGS